MQIVPFVGEEIVTASTISVRVNAKDRDRAEFMVKSTSGLVAVPDNDAFQTIRRAAGQLKSLITEIEDSRKAAKRPFAAVEKAINDLASEVGQPVQAEHNRLLGLLNGYVTRLEAAAKEEQRKKDEALAKQAAIQQERLKEAQAAQAKAEAEARAAKNEADQLKAREVARQKAAAAESVQLAAEMAGEIAKIGEQPKRGFVPGGRVDHLHEFKLVDVKTCVSNGGFKLLRWELDKRACQDAVKLQLELNPNAPPSLPGIEITQKTSVSVRASARIE
jgi:hypothetical protein